ncbi:MAG: DUF2190 family protein [Gammaproteobacteria bacterium]
MARNYQQTGDVLTYLNDSSQSYQSGDVVVFGQRIGVALSDIAVDDLEAIQVVGVFELPKASEDILTGALLFWDSNQQQMTLIADGNTPAGCAFANAEAADAYVDIKINA